jgi:hypothetical protein
MIFLYVIQFISGSIVMLNILDVESAPRPHEYEKLRLGILSVDMACMYASLGSQLLSG